MGAKIFKFSGYYVDPNGDWSKSWVVDELERADLIPRHLSIEEVDIGEWDDDNPLNYYKCPKEECEKYFKK